MKTFTLTAALVLLLFQNTFSLVGEYLFYIYDLQNTNYWVVVRRININDPLFGANHMEVNTDSFDEVVSYEDAFGYNPPSPYNIRRGFDLLWEGSHVWPLIGNGKLEFSIYREEAGGGSTLVYRFKLDNVHSEEPDLTFQYSSYTGEMLVTISGGQIIEIQFDQYLKTWELLNQQQDTSPFVNNVELTNFLATGPESNIKTIFTDAPMGFPDPSTQIGVQYNPGVFVPLWRGVFYGVTTSHTTYTKNNVIYYFRNWNNYNSFASSTTLRILEGTSEFRSMFQPTHPLTILNNLEGGSSNNNYQLTWQNPPHTQPWQFGNAFNAFDFQENLDRYTVTAPSTIQALGTTWWFNRWEDDVYYHIKSNIQVSSPASFTAYYKGHLRSDDQNAISSGSQRKLVRTDNGIYHLVYESLGSVYYTHSLTSNFNGNWSQEYLIETESKNPSIDFEENAIKIVFETNEPTLPVTPAIYMKTFIPGTGQPGTGSYQMTSEELVVEISSSYFGNSKPVIAYTNIMQFIAYRKNIQDGIYHRSKIYSEGSWQWGSEHLIPNTSTNSNNITVTAIGNTVRFAYEHGLSIRYMHAIPNGVDSWQYSNYANISSGSGYSNNISPSISSAGNAYVVSWIGTNASSDTVTAEKIDGVEDGREESSKVVVRRGYQANWSSFFKAGNNVTSTNNNSVTGTSNEATVITWNEGINPNYSSKWVRRVNGDYTSTRSISHNGKQNQVSNGTSLNNIGGTVFSVSTLPYNLNLTTTDFSQIFREEQELNKINEAIELSYGREGIVYKNGVEFLFNIGDVIVGDSVIRFIEQPDTVNYTSAEELNQAVKTESFYLSPSTEFYFTNFYYVLYEELADSALTEFDLVNFKAELVNSLTNQVIGTFDNITYKKEQLEKYDNVSYQVDCSNIIAGDYYLRLVTMVEGEAEYFLGNVQNSGQVLNKKLYKQIKFDGTTIPEIYDLSQNYPNPFNPSTTIRYQIPHDGMVTLKVYDILGSEVATLVNEQKSVGRYEINFDATSLASGVYLYKIQSGNFVQTKKMIILK